MLSFKFWPSPTQFKRSLLLVTASLFVLVTVATALPSPTKTYAASSTTYKTETDVTLKIQAAVYYKAIEYCSNYREGNGAYENSDYGTKQRLNASTLDKGVGWWMEANADIGMSNIVIGIYVDQWSTDGLTHCNGESDSNRGWLAAAMEMFFPGDSSDNLKLAEDLGYKCSVGSDGNRECLLPKHSSADGQKWWLDATWADYVVKNSPYLNGQKPDTDLDAANYYAAKLLLLSKCAFNTGTSTGIVTYSEVNETNGKIVNVSGGTNGAKDWFGLYIGGPVDENDPTIANKMDCATLAKITRDNAAGFAAWKGVSQMCQNMSIMSKASVQELRACGTGWANSDSLFKCVERFPTSDSLRIACFWGQGQQQDSSTKKPVGERCIESVGTDSVDTFSGCVAGANSNREDTSFCNNKYPPSYGGGTTDRNAAARTACTTAASTISVDGAPAAGAYAGALTTDTAWLTGGTGNEAEILDCGSPALNFFLCPIVTLLSNAAGTLDSWIMSTLNLDTTSMFDKSDPQGSGTAYYTAWNSFRLLAVGLLVVVGLFMVISQALGMQIMDAYTVKKVLPRLLIAAIGISLSWPLLEFTINFFNTLGVDTRQLLYSPFSAIGSHVDVGFASIAGTGTIAVFALTLGPVALTFILTAVIAAFVGFIVLIIRQIMVTLLVIIIPIAIVAYILPNTQKAWKLWSSTFMGLMLMFPLISALIAIGHIFAQISFKQGNDLIHQTIGMIAYFAPYFMIPFAAKMSGGAIGQIAGILSKGASGLNKQLSAVRAKSGAAHREQLGRPIGRRILSGRANLNTYLQKNASNGDRSAFTRKALRGVARGVGGYNIEAAYSAKNASVAKEIQDQIATGDDAEIRGLTADVTKGPTRNAKGEMVYTSAAGKELSEAVVKRAYSRWGHDTFAQQAALTYEMSKASSEEEVQSIAKSYPSLATKAWGQSDSRATSTWIGSSFGNQNLHLEYKNMRMGSSGAMELNDVGRKSFVNELYERRGSYNVAQMTSNTIEELKNSYVSAQARAASGDLEALDQSQKIAAIAETFMHEAGMGGGVVGMTGDGSVPVTSDPSSRRQASTPGSAHTSERVRELAELTRVLGASPAGLYTDPGHAPTPNNREQK